MNDQKMKLKKDYSPYPGVVITPVGMVQASPELIESLKQQKALRKGKLSKPVVLGGKTFYPDGIVSCSTAHLEALEGAGYVEAVEAVKEAQVKDTRAQKHKE